VEDIFTKPLPRESFEYLSQRHEVISTPKWIILNFCLICIRCTWGSTIKRTIQSGGLAPDGKIPLPMMIKGERFIRCRGQRHGSMGNNGHRDVEDKGMFLGGAWVIWI
jgi:hypothetical protein